MTATTTPEDCRHYRPRGAAKALFPNRSLELLIEGPAGTGKTRAVLEKINRWLLKSRGSRVLITRKTRESMSQSVLVTLEEKVLPDNPDEYPITGDVQRRNRGSYLYPNGSELVVGGLDKPAKIMSTEYDMIAVFEATEATESDWEMLLSRLRNNVMPYQQIVADCNPGPPTHWLNKRADNGAMQRLLSRHVDNPTMHDGQNWTAFGRTYLDTLRRLTGARATRLLDGRWAASEGLVYGEFDPDIHVIKSFDIPGSWRRIRAIDFGFSNPFVCQWWAIDGDGRMFLYREIYKSKMIVQDHAERIKRLSDADRIEKTVSDHDAEDRETLHRYGVMTQPAFKAITPGIEAVNSRLRVAKDGRARLFVFENVLDQRDEHLVESKLPVNCVQEFDTYAYPKAADGKSQKEEPIDANNHAMDAMRYAVAYVDDIGHQKVTFNTGFSI